LICSLTQAELQVFRERNYPIENPPRNVEDAVKFAKDIKAQNSTSPSASLYPYLRDKKVVKTFIIVTDEEENTSCNSESSYWGTDITKDNFFSDLYKQYIEQVSPAKLIFISFTDPNKDGMMVSALKKVIGETKVQEFVDVYKFSIKNPDLKRLDFILSKLARQVISEILDDMVVV